MLMEGKWKMTFLSCARLSLCCRQFNVYLYNLYVYAHLYFFILKQMRRVLYCNDARIVSLGITSGSHSFHKNFPYNVRDENDFRISGWKLGKRKSLYILLLYNVRILYCCTRIHIHIILMLYTLQQNSKRAPH